jgi:hypothetical protein
VLRGRCATAIAILCGAALVAAGCTSEVSSPVPTTVDPATASGSAGLFTVKLGVIVNTSAPTADRDSRVVDVISAATNLSTASIAVDLEVIEIDEVSDTSSAVGALIERGVTVIAALCDDATVPAVVDASVAAGVLAVTACVTIPRPTLTVSSPLFLDLAGLPDAADALAEWSVEREASRVATLRSDLVPDVENACVDYERAIAARGLSLTVSSTFTELLDDEDELVASVAPLLEDADLIAMCSLPPTAGTLVTALRAAGFEQPIVVPWFTDGQLWPATTDDVFVIAPASRYGDEPNEEIRALLTSIGSDAQATDIVAADMIAMLSSAAGRSGSIGSTRIAEAIRGETSEVLSGELRVSNDGSGPDGRTYRVIAVDDGQPMFDSLITPEQTPR